MSGVWVLGAGMVSPDNNVLDVIKLNAGLKERNIYSNNAADVVKISTPSQSVMCLQSIEYSIQIQSLRGENAC